MRLEELVAAVVDDYYAATLPLEPQDRLAFLRELVRGRLERLEPHARLALEAEADAAEDAFTLGRDEDDVPDAEIEAVDDRAVDSFTELIRHRIPELSPP